MKAIILFLSIGFCNIVYADETQSSESDNIIIFTGEVRNFLDIAGGLKELSHEDATKNEKQILDRVKILQLTSTRIADAYFQEQNPENREKFAKFLQETLHSNRDLKNYFIIMGNAFATEGQRLLNERSGNMHRIAVWSSISGVVLGLAGGYVFLKFKNNVTQAGLVALGITTLAAAGGYSARYYIPIDSSVKTAEDFLQRFPKGEDFIREVDAHPDLTAILDGAKEASDDL